MTSAGRLTIGHDKFAPGHSGQSFTTRAMAPAPARPMQRRVWEEVPVDAVRVQTVADALRVPLVVAQLLCQRNLDDPEAAHRFLHPELTHLHDPFLLAGMREAVDRLHGAIARHERIVIYGDYDVDGVTATVILRRVIELLGGNVIICSRSDEGRLRLQPETVDRLHAAGRRSSCPWIGGSGG
jgi:single-stranded-DNA-specific exonuclease